MRNTFIFIIFDRNNAVNTEITTVMSNEDLPTREELARCICDEWEIPIDEFELMDQIQTTGTLASLDMEEESYILSM